MNAEREAYIVLLARCQAASVGGSLVVAVDVEADCLLDYAVRMNRARRTAKARRTALESAQVFYTTDVLGFLARLEAGETIEITADDVLYNRRTASAKAIAMLVHRHERRFGR